MSESACFQRHTFRNMGRIFAFLSLHLSLLLRRANTASLAEMSVTLPHGNDRDFQNAKQLKRQKYAPSFSFSVLLCQQLNEPLHLKLIKSDMIRLTHLNVLLNARNTDMQVEPRSFWKEFALTVTLWIWTRTNEC